MARGRSGGGGLRQTRRGDGTGDTRRTNQDALPEPPVQGLDRAHQVPLRCAVYDEHPHALAGAHQFVRSVGSDQLDLSVRCCSPKHLVQGYQRGRRQRIAGEPRLRQRHAIHMHHTARDCASLGGERRDDNRVGPPQRMHEG